MSKVSIIVPVYNVEKYIGMCIESILKQTFPDWELILVDDGSTDGSYKIIKTLGEKDYRIKCYHKTNGGLSDARNYGIEKAKGKYIFFLDGDDWIAPWTIQTLYNGVTMYDCEIAQCGLYYAYPNYLLLDETKIKRTASPIIIDNKQAMTELIKNEYVKSFACGKLYLSEIVRKYNFPKGKYFEDCYWQHLIFSEIKKMCLIPKPCYYYRQRDSSISGRFTERNLDLLKGYENRLAFIKSNYPELTELMYKKYTTLARCQMYEAIKTGNYELITMYKKYLDSRNIKFNLYIYNIEVFLRRIYIHFFCKKFTELKYD